MDEVPLQRKFALLDMHSLPTPSMAASAAQRRSPRSPRVTADTVVRRLHPVMLPPLQVGRGAASPRGGEPVSSPRASTARRSVLDASDVAVFHAAQVALKGGPRDADEHIEMLERARRVLLLNLDHQHRHAASSIAAAVIPEHTARTKLQHIEVVRTGRWHQRSRRNLAIWKQNE